VGVRVWIRIKVWINRRPITSQYFIAYNGITTPIDYWLQRAERLGVNISLTKPIWKLLNDKSVRYFVKRAYCCIVAILIMTYVLLYQVYLFLNCMGRAVILD
jgi:hypothetical protein